MISFFGTARRRRVALGLAALAVAATAGLVLRGAPHAEAQSTSGQEKPAAVLAASVELRDMPVTLTEVGTVQPLATVAVKSRIDGLVVDVPFTEGAWVDAGDVLFRLDDRMARANLAQAEANLARDRAQLADANRALDRAKSLAARDFATKATLDTANANVAALTASVQADLAQIDALKTSLDYTVIRAPIAGRTGTITTKLGSNVKANDTNAMVTINQTRPVQVAFSVPQGELAALREAAAKGPLAVKATIKGSKPVSATGSLAFIDNAIDQTTGTIELRATFPNDGETLWPGAFVDVAVTLETRPNVAAVPATAVLIGQDGPYAFVIKPDSMVEPRKVAVDRTVDGTTFVRDGLAAGERVVTDGQLRLTRGSKVTVRTDRSAQPSS